MVTDLCIACQDSRLQSAVLGNIHVCGTNLKLTTGAFSVAEPRHYNTLPTQLWQAGSHVTFCSKLKTHFFNLTLVTTHNVFLSRHVVCECYCALHVLGFNYFMSVRSHWAPVRGTLLSSHYDDDDGQCHLHLPNLPVCFYCCQKVRPTCNTHTTNWGITFMTYTFFLFFQQTACFEKFLFSLLFSCTQTMLSMLYVASIIISHISVNISIAQLHNQ